MRISPKSLVPIFFIAFFISCSKKDHETKPTCVYRGKTDLYAYTGGIGSKSTGTSELDYDDPKMPRSLTRTFIRESTDEVTNDAISKVTETLRFTFQYDMDGFLKTMVAHRSYEFLGFGKAHYQHNNQVFSNFKLDEVRTSNFSYQAGRATSISAKTVTTTKGDSQPPVVVELEESKTYQYDENGKAMSAATISAEGSIASTFVNGVIASEIQKNKNGAIISETKYNSMGLNSSITSNGSTYEMGWDTRGNLTSVQLKNNGKIIYIQEFGYDDYENPENTINQIFKGIPEAIKTIQLTDGVNNQISEISTNEKGEVASKIKTVYRYNSAGMPESSIMSRIGDAPVQLKTTSFRYKCP
ncbi:hypothetical protein [Dyadobacter sp. OTU695]|uniref:hypothetical protein n=1 Tax=Dyadobacter sp. OTU695 TaxID=3043860 RepID=UPI00313AD318